MSCKQNESRYTLNTLEEYDGLKNAHADLLCSWLKSINNSRMVCQQVYNLPHLKSSSLLSLETPWSKLSWACWFVVPVSVPSDCFCKRLSWGFNTTDVLPFLNYSWILKIICEKERKVSSRRSPKLMFDNWLFRLFDKLARLNLEYTPLSLAVF